jgi:hypothetical protein
LTGGAVAALTKARACVPGLPSTTHIDMRVTAVFRPLDGRVIGDLAGVSKSQLAVRPGTTHVTLVDRADLLLPMITRFLDARPCRRPGERAVDGAAVRSTWLTRRSSTIRSAQRGGTKQYATICLARA